RGGDWRLDGVFLRVELVDDPRGPLASVVCKATACVTDIVAGEDREVFTLVTGQRRRACGEGLYAAGGCAGPPASGGGDAAGDDSYGGQCHGHRSGASRPSVRPNPKPVV